MNTTPYPEISDYALIGDSRTAALTSIQGSIDWLCLPRFDGLSLFNRLLDYWHGGHFTITPTRSYSSRRHYQTSTAILVTEFQTDEGSVRVTDLVPVLSEAEKRTCLLPFWSLLRRIDGIEGTVELDMVFKPRPEHGRVIPQFHSRGRAGYFADLGDRLLHLATDVSLQIKKGEVGGRFVIRAGEQRVFWFAYSEDAPAVYPVVSQAGWALDKTRAFWETWAERCTYRGPHRNAVIRSAVTLKLLSFAPSGAIVAAPTTSLPEAIGGERNWDYRYCWLRDAAYTVRCFFKLGYTDEATAFVLWLMHATTLTAPALKVLYALCGETFLPQKNLELLEGYKGSQPVRTGNRAYTQYQLDIYGEVLDSLLLYVQGGGAVDREMGRRLIEMADLVVSEWSLPDHGIWEVAGPRRHYVHSKVMCWVALDRAKQIVQRLQLRADLHAWEKAGDAIRQCVRDGGFSSRLKSFVQTLGGEHVDATALTFSLSGFVDPHDPGMISTIDVVRNTLGREDLLYRYLMEDGLPGQEGAFLACSFWLVEALAVTGRTHEAEKLFEKLHERANDVGLYPEQVLPSDGRMLGNFPQALTHLSHISAALRLYSR